MAAEAFFARLPRGTLSHEETELRGLLHDTAAAVQRLLPRTGVVSLTQWMERRMPGELFLGADSSGSVTLRLESRPPARPTKVASVRTEDFFLSLPDNDFSPDEMRLHDVLLEILARGPAEVARMLQDGQVKLAMSFVPHGVRLEEWIERRIGQEIVVFTNQAGQEMLKKAPPSKEDRINQVEAFFDELPEGSFTDTELQLRDAILNAVEVQGPTTLSKIGSEPEVSAARKAFLVKSVSLKEWVHRRIASEVVLDEAPNGQWNVRLVHDTGKGAPRRQDGKNQSGKGKHREAHEERFDVDGQFEDEQTRLEREEQRERDLVDKAARRDQFFDDLPADTLSPEELDLRGALLDFLDGWDKDTIPSLSNAGAIEQVSKGRAALLPGRTCSLREWIERRIGGEIEVIPNEVNSEVFIGKRDEIDPVALQKSIDRLQAPKHGHGSRRGNRAGEQRGDKGKGDKGKGDKGNLSKGNGKQKTDVKGRAIVDSGGQKGSGGQKRAMGKGFGGTGMQPFSKRKRM